MLGTIGSLIFRPKTARYGPADDYWYRPVGAATATGIDVTVENAMTVPAVFRCVTLLADTIGSLPWRVYRSSFTDTRLKTQETKLPLWRTLHTAPNSWQTAMDWRSLGMCHVALRGNFYNRIERQGNSIDLIPLNPDRMQVTLNRGTIAYKYSEPAGPEVTYSQDEIFHVRGPTLNGITGLSVLSYARESVGSSLAKRTHGSSLFKNGGLPTFWIKRPKGVKWTTDARRNFREGWRKIHGGAENAGNPPILEDDMELKEIGVSNKDSQWIEAMGFDAVDICRFFGVPPHLVGILDRATFSNIEQQSIEFVTYCIRPIAVRWEQAANRDLVDESDLYTKLVLEGLMRGDIASRYTAYNVGIQSGFLTRNEVRELEDLNPIDGGDEALEPLNMVPLGQRDEPPAQSPQRDEPPAQDDDEMPKRKKKASTALFGAWIADAAERIAAAEIHGLSGRSGKAAGDRSKWNQWAATFYEEKQVPYAHKTLHPIIKALLADGAPLESLSLPVDISAPPIVFDVTVDVSEMLKTWQTTRAGELTAILHGVFQSCVTN